MSWVDIVMRQSAIERHKEFFEKLTLSNSWWSSPTLEILNKFALMGWIKRTPLPWEARTYNHSWDDALPTCQTLYTGQTHTAQDTVSILSFPSKGSDPVWSSIDESLKLTEVNRYQIYPRPRQLIIYPLNQVTNRS